MIFYVVGYFCMGLKRELKFVLELMWDGKI